MIIADVPTETERYRRRFWRFTNIIYIPLGEGKTAATLFQHTDVHLRNAVAKLAPMNASDGMGSLPGIGYQAAMKTIHSVEFERILQDIADRVLIATQGAPHEVLVDTSASIAGGTGGGAVVLLSDAIVRGLSDLEIPIRWRYDLVGAVGFASLANRASINAASSLWRLLKYLIQSKQHNGLWAVESARFLEIPPYGHNDAARKQFLALDEQSWKASAVQQHLQMIEPNDAMDGRFGNITSWQLDHSDCLNASTEVVPTVAMAMRQSLNEALQSSGPKLSRVSRITESEKTTSLTRESVDSIIDRSDDVDEAIKDICSPEFVHSFHFAVIIDEVREFNLDQITLDFSFTPKTVSEFTDSVQILASMEAELSANQQIAEDLLSSMTAEQAQLIDDLAVRLERLFTGRLPRLDFRGRFLASIQSDAETLRAMSDQIERQQAKVNSLQTVVTNVSDELRYLREHVSLTEEALTEWCPRGTAIREREPLVTVRPADAVFSDLWSLPTRPREEQLELLSQWTGAVTLHGLAKIVGAQAPRFELIAEKIAGECFTVEGPPLGAKKQRRQVSEIVVLPPLQPEYRDILIKQIRELNPHRFVATADSAASGVTVVRYKVFSVSSLVEMFPGRLRADLRRAFNHPSRDLFFPDGTEGLAEDLAAFDMPQPNDESERRLS